MFQEDPQGELGALSIVKGKTSASSGGPVRRIIKEKLDVMPLS